MSIRLGERKVTFLNGDPVVPQNLGIDKKGVLFNRYHYEETGKLSKPLEIVRGQVVYDSRERARNRAEHRGIVEAFRDGPDENFLKWCKAIEAILDK